jgi:23S rRNA pseudouridine2604 synthase
MKDSPNSPLRLSKRMSELGLCSRREADRLIEQGLVLVNGSIVDQLGTKVLPTDKIELRQRAQEQLAEKVSVMLNKPIKFTSHGNDQGYPTVLDLILKKNQSDLERPFSIKIKEGLGPVGRLDIESQGLMLLSQDGRVAKAVIGEHVEMEKEYLVRFVGELNKEKISKLSRGEIVLDGRRLKEALVEQINEDQLRIVLVEGVKRQIRRMMDIVDLQVTGLKRVRIGPLRLGNLPEGMWRHLTEEEVQGLLENAPAPAPKKRFPRR